MQPIDLTIAGKAYPAHLGFAALADFTTVTGKTLADLSHPGRDMDIHTMGALFWAALKHGARRRGQPFELSVVDVLDLFDEDPAAMAQMQLITEAFMQPKHTQEGEMAGKTMPGARRKS